jgi:hypothetical protein
MNLVGGCEGTFAGQLLSTFSCFGRQQQAILQLCLPQASHAVEGSNR